MNGFLSDITFWYWFVLGFVMVIAEIFAPGVVFLWIGIAAFIVGIEVLIFPGTGWEIQFILFGALSVISVVGGRMFLKRRPIQSDHPTLNLRGERYVGRVLELETAIQNGRGRARVGDTVWQVSGPDLEAGTTVTVTGVEGNTLKVEEAES